MASTAPRQSQHADVDPALTKPAPSVEGPVAAALRRSLPKELFVKKPIGFAARFWFAVALIAAGWWTVAASYGLVATACAIVVLGLMYAHLVELQHECVHEHGFRSRHLNHFYGRACGIFMLSSYSHYKYEHLRHHASLGKPSNREFFNYQYDKLESAWRFVRAAFHLGRYATVAREVARSLRGRPLPGVPERQAVTIRHEYVGHLAIVLAAVAGSVATGSTLLLVAWLLPLLVVSEPVHFVIELPEHFGLNTQTDANVLRNTRTVRASRLARWFTNGNNLHTAHHFSPGVPMANVSRLDELIEQQYEVIEPSYWSFFRKVGHGEIVYQGAPAPPADERP